jgi:hypothetical protein
MRLPSYAGAFYSGTKEELESELNLLFQVESKTFEDAKGIIVPHAGYMYSGQVAAKAYKAISRINKKRFVILGVDHYATNVIATSEQDWITPLSIAKIDKEFVNKITKEQAVIVDEPAMRREHSIEVQLPFLQYIFRDFKFVPIQIPSIGYKEIMELAKILVDRDTFYIASSDLTHFGINYNFFPEESRYDPVGYMENLDQKIIRSIQDFNPKKFLDYVVQNDLTVCGVMPITLLLEITKNLEATKIEKIAYTNSFSILKDNSSIVGYGSLLIH